MKIKKNQVLSENCIKPKSYSIWPGKLLRNLIIIFLMLFVNFVHANNALEQQNGSFQEREITGTVTDRTGDPIPGVNVVIKGTTTGTITNEDGEFLLSIPSDAEVIVFSYIGMETQEVEITSSSVYDITLSDSAVDLDEVVVVGYGVVQRSDLTGSVSRVDNEKIREMAPTQVTEALSGTVAGLYSVQGSSAAGGGSLELRGPSSLAASSSPLIVVDGVIFQGSMREINPTDIETIDVLRDASSAAIFGSRAAAGVILITTKSGEIGKPTVSFSTKVGVSSTTNDFYQYGMDPDGDPMDYFRMHRDLKYQESDGSVPYHYYWHPDNLPGDVSTEEWRNYADNPNSDPLEEWFNRIAIWPIEKENYLAGRTTNFYDLAINTGIRQDYNINVSGATEDIRYYWSLGYIDNEGIITGDSFSAIRTRLNLDFDVTDWLKIGTNTQFTNRDESVVQANLGYLAQMSPYGSMWEEDGSIKWYPNDYTIAHNPLGNYYGQDRLRDINSLNSNLYAELKLPYGITYRVTYQPRFAFTKDFNFWDSETTTGRISHSNGYGRRVHSQSYNWQLDNLVKWNKEYGIHKFDVTLLANAERNQSWYSNQYNEDFSPNENLIYHALQFGSQPGLSNNDVVSSGDALMARLNYTLLNKYLFTASARRDGYSAFGQKNPRATFPSVAFAWKIDEESFFNSSWMNRLKLRLTWGENGNRSIGTYSALAQLGSVLSYSSTGNVETGVYNTTLANPNLVWERTESFNIGVDLGLFDNRVDLTVDAYDATTADLLLNRELPQITGFSSITSNLGRLGNQGVEATLNTININNANFNWRSSVVFSLNRNKIKELWGDEGDFTLLNEERSGELPDFQNHWFPGYARDIVWDYDRIGIWQLDESEEAAVYGLEPGDYKADDVNEDGEYTQFEDKKFIGYTAPRSRWGFRNEMSFFTNFTATLFIRADLGHIRAVPITGNRTTHDRRNDWAWGYWSPENPDSEFQRNLAPDNTGRFGGGIRPFVPTGYLRVQDFSLAYNVPADKLQRIVPFQSLRVNVTGRNLYTVTNWPGFDPESGNSPMPKTWTIGVDITL